MRAMDEKGIALSMQRNRLLQFFTMKSLAIYGSFSREEYSDESDLDISHTIVFGKKHSEISFIFSQLVKSF